MLFRSLYKRSMLVALATSVTVKPVVVNPLTDSNIAWEKVKSPVRTKGALTFRTQSEARAPGSCCPATCAGLTTPTQTPRGAGPLPLTPSPDLSQMNNSRKTRGFGVRFAGFQLRILCFLGGSSWTNSDAVFQLAKWRAAVS